MTSVEFTGYVKTQWTVIWGFWKEFLTSYDSKTFQDNCYDYFWSIDDEYCDIFHYLFLALNDYAKWMDNYLKESGNRSEGKEAKIKFCYNQVWFFWQRHLKGEDFSSVKKDVDKLLKDYPRSYTYYFLLSFQQAVNHLNAINKKTK